MTTTEIVFLLIKYIVVPAAVAIMGLGFMGLGRLAWFHMKAGLMRHFTLAVLTAGRTGALYVEQKVVPTIKGKDGWEAEAKLAAVAAATEWLTSSGYKTLQMFLGMKDEDLAKQLGVAVEASLPNLMSPEPIETLK